MSDIPEDPPDDDVSKDDSDANEKGATGASDGSDDDGWTLERATAAPESNETSEKRRSHFESFEDTPHESAPSVDASKESDAEVFGAQPEEAAPRSAHLDGDTAPPRRSHTDTAPPTRESTPVARPTSRAGRVVGIGAAVVFALLVITGSVLGYLNSRNFYIVCAAEEIRPERGRFLPWGQAPMAGEGYVPMKVAVGSVCTPKRYASEDLLATAYSHLLISQSGRELVPGPPPDLNVSEGRLDQAALLNRSVEDVDQRVRIRKLRGDVAYWRARDKLSRAEEVLGASADAFTQAIQLGSRLHSRAEAERESALAVLRALQGGEPPPAPEVTAEPTLLGPAPPEPRPTSDVEPAEKAEEGGPGPGPEPAPPAAPEAVPPSTLDRIPRGGVLL